MDSFIHRLTVFPRLITNYFMFMDQNCELHSRLTDLYNSGDEYYDDIDKQGPVEVEVSLRHRPGFMERFSSSSLSHLDRNYDSSDYDSEGFFRRFYQFRSPFTV